LAGKTDASAAEKEIVGARREVGPSAANETAGSLEAVHAAVAVVIKRSPAVGLVSTESNSHA
jgi:hypothetical protein